MPRFEFEPCELGDVPMEEAKLLIGALAKRLCLKLERREEFYGETEYRFVGEHNKELIEALK